MTRLRQTEQSVISVGHLADDSLRRLAKHFRRELEDIADGDLARPERVVRAELHDVEVEADLREALRETWRAEEFGTDSYTDYIARGGHGAVLCCHGLRPSYRLALTLDRGNYELGGGHCLAWGHEQLPEDHPARQTNPFIHSACPGCGYDHMEDVLDRPVGERLGEGGELVLAPPS